MEPLRPVIDATALEFVQGNTFDPQDFTLDTDVTCRLHPAMARRVVAEVDKIAGVQSLVSEMLKLLGR